MKKSKLFNPADYNPAANPVLAKTNSPWRFWGTFLFISLTCFLAWHLLRPPVRVSRPTLDFEANRVTATTLVINDTRQPVRLSLRFVLAYATPATDATPSQYDIVSQRDVEAHIPAHSTDQVRCEFALSRPSVRLRADVHILGGGIRLKAVTPNP